MTSIDASGQDLGPGEVIVLAAAISTDAAINSLTVSSTSNMDDQNVYTLTTGEPALDLSSKNLGRADVNLLAVWIQRPEVNAVINSLAVGSNPIGDEAMVQLLDGLKDVSLTSLDISTTKSG
eukprot:COSAG01_NODE_6332_length_3731_cov_7.563051_2_plen_121_part_01